MHEASSFQGRRRSSRNVSRGTRTEEISPSPSASQQLDSDSMYGTPDERSLHEGTVLSSLDRDIVAYDFEEDGQRTFHFKSNGLTGHPISHFQINLNRPINDPRFQINCFLPPKTVRLVLRQTRADKLSEKIQLAAPVIKEPSRIARSECCERCERRLSHRSRSRAGPHRGRPRRTISRSRPRSKTRSRATRRRARSYSSSSARSDTSASNSNADDSEQSSDQLPSWKAYHGASGLETARLLDIWEPQNERVELKIGTNCIVKHDEWSSLIVQSIGRTEESHSLILNGSLIGFCTLPNLLRSTWYRQDAVEMELVVSKPLDINRLGEVLQDIVRSKSSAMSVYAGQTDVGVRLLTLDILTAVVYCWHDFLKSVHRRGAWRSRNVGSLDDIENKLPLFGDREYVADFAKATRDLVRACQVNIEAIELLASFDDIQRRKFKNTVLKNKLYQEMIKEVMADIESDIDSITASGDRLANEKEQASLKRLTLVASIFLPLTTASGVLSMNNRVVNTGAIWWDWLGIVLILGFVVVLGYKFTSAWNRTLRNARIRWLFRLFSGEYQNAKAKALKKASNQATNQHNFQERSEVWTHLSWPLLCVFYLIFIAPFGLAGRFQEEATYFIKALRKLVKGNQERKLVSLWPKLVLQTSPYLLWSGVIASFLTGMFVDVDSGVVVLGYCIAGAIAFVVAAVLLWRLCQIVQWLSSNSADRHKRDRQSRVSPEGQAPNANTLNDRAPSSENRDGNADPEPGIKDNSSESANKSSERSHLLRFPKVIFVAPLALIALIVFCVCYVWGFFLYALVIFFFGTLVVDVWFRTITDGITMIWRNIVRTDPELGWKAQARKKKNRRKVRLRSVVRAK